MKFKMSDKVKNILKFEAKLLLGVALLSLFVYWGANKVIYTAGEKVANAYTSTDPLFK